MTNFSHQGLSDMPSWLSAACDFQVGQSAGAPMAPIPTGWPALDEKIIGLQRGELMLVVAGRQVGKTAFVLNLVRQIGLRQSLETRMFAPGSCGVELSLRLLATELAIDVQRLRTGKLSEAEWRLFSDAMGSFSKAPIHLATDAGYCPTRICLEAMQTGKPSLLVIDDLAATMRNMHSKSPNEALRTLKLLAKTLNAAVLVTFGLSAALARRRDPRPQLSDLAACGISLAQVETVLFIHREECYTPGTPDIGIAEVAIAAQRHGPTGNIISLHFSGDHQRFSSLRSMGPFPYPGSAHA